MLPKVANGAQLEAGRDGSPGFTDKGPTVLARDQFADLTDTSLSHTPPGARSKSIERGNDFRRDPDPVAPSGTSLLQNPRLRELLNGTLRCRQRHAQCLLQVRDQ